MSVSLFELSVKFFFASPDRAFFSLLRRPQSRLALFGGRSQTQASISKREKNILDIGKKSVVLEFPCIAINAAFCSMAHR